MHVKPLSLLLVTLAGATVGCSLLLSTSGLEGGSPADSGVDSGSVDSGTVDSGSVDSGIDSGTVDSGSMDSTRPDTSIADTFAPDTFTPETTVDAGPPEAVVDTAVVDTSTDAGSCPTCVLTVQYRTFAPEPTRGDLKPQLQIVNASTDDQPLSELTIRYWYTINGERPQVTECDFAAMGCENVVVTFVKMTTSKTNANYYAEVSFKAGIVPGSGNSGEIQPRLHKDDYSNYTQTDDYSFDATKSVYAEWTHVTLYRKGVLVYGVEPP